MKHFFSISVLMLIVIMVCTACGNTAVTADANADQTTTASKETEAVSTDLAVIKNGVSNYTIIRAEEAQKDAIEIASRIRSLIGSQTEVYPDLGTDWVKSGTEHDHSTLEILVGATAYSESTEALEGLGYGEYVIKQVGQKLVINAWSTTGLDKAVTEFARQVIANGEKGSFILPAGINIVGTAFKLASAIPHYDGGVISTIYDVNNNSHMLLINETNANEYATYRKTMESAGYTLYAENDITENRFSTYINEEYVINAGYYAYENATRIVIEPRTVLPILESENIYEKKVQPSFLMLGLEFVYGSALAQNGLGFVYQLSDGSYIIVDGGFERARDAKAIYEYMRENAPDPNNITIAAWIITHAHGDHNGAYSQFSDLFSQKVKLELLVGNFPSDDAREEAEIGTEGGSGGVNGDIMTDLKKFSGAKFLKVHAGQVLYLRDAKVEVLYTHESYAPRSLSYFNTSSLVFSLEIAGQKFMILGDASNDACNIVNKMYGDYLKSDFVHAAHHGYTTGSTAYSGVTSVYSETAAPVVFWPIGEQDYYNSMHTRAYSAHLQNLETTREIFVAGSRDVRIMLPYTYGTSGYNSILK